MRRPGIFWLYLLTHILLLAPIAWLVWDFTRGQLGANPVQEIQLRTGRITLNLLVLTLACTPAYNIFHFKAALTLRRRLGLYTFLYASLHFLNFIGVDYGFNLALLRADIAGKRFVLAGFAAFLILLALAMTSSAGWKKRLGKNWERLHRLIHGAALLGALHFVWLTKADLRVPLIYTGIIVLLLVVRIPRIAERVKMRWEKDEG